MKDATAAAAAGRRARCSHTPADLFAWAVAQRTYGLARSPCIEIKTKDLIGSKKTHLKPRKRVLTNEEVVFIWRAAARVGYPFGQLVQLLLLLAVRLNDATQAIWSELDLDPHGVPDEDGDTGPLWVIPAERMKMDAAHEVPLPAAAVEIIKSLPRFRGKYLFTTTDGTVPVSGFSKMKKRLDAVIAELRQEAGLEPMAHWILHDLRRTARTRLGNLEVPDLIAELILAHQREELHEVYDQGRYRRPKRRALERWARHLDSIVSGRPANVVDLHAEAG